MKHGGSRLSDFKVVRNASLVFFVALIKTDLLSFKSSCSRSITKRPGIKLKASEETKIKFGLEFSLIHINVKIPAKRRRSLNGECHGKLPTRDSTSRFLTFFVQRKLRFSFLCYSQIPNRESEQVIEFDVFRGEDQTLPFTMARHLRVEINVRVI